MRSKKFLFYMIAVLLGGCIPVMSLHPLYTQENVVFDERLLGTWVDDPNKPGTTWEFKRLEKTEDANDKAYQLLFTDTEGKKGSFVAHLLKLDNKLFIDAYPSQVPWQPKDPNRVEWLYNTFFLIPAHTFLKIDSIPATARSSAETSEPILKIHLTSEDKMKDFLKENPTSIQHTIVEERTVLTSPTKELQVFVQKYAGDERVFVDAIALVRKQNKK